MRMNMTRILGFDIDISHTYFSWRHQTYWLPRVPKCSCSAGVTAGRRIQLIGTTQNNPRLLIAFLWICHQSNTSWTWMNVLYLSAGRFTHTREHKLDIEHFPEDTEHRRSKWRRADRSVSPQWSYLTCALTPLEVTHISPQEDNIEVIKPFPWLQ